jgi:hypothetical protein
MRLTAHLRRPAATETAHRSSSAFSTRTKAITGSDFHSSVDELVAVMESFFAYHQNLDGSTPSVGKLCGFRCAFKYIHDFCGQVYAPFERFEMIFRGLRRRETQERSTGKRKMEEGTHSRHTCSQLPTLVATAPESAGSTTPGSAASTDGTRKHGLNGLGGIGKRGGLSGLDGIGKCGRCEHDEMTEDLVQGRGEGVSAYGYVSRQWTLKNI